MDRGQQRSEELRLLRSLCDETSPREARQKLLNSVRSDFFVEPEHQILFDSIRALFPTGPLTEERLRVHLTRRGFPDTEVAHYFRPRVGPEA